ncbi:MAG: hypothetical protein ACTSRZ_17650 [Promethearchaeota archaeon]
MIHFEELTLIQNKEYINLKIEKGIERTEFTTIKECAENLFQYYSNEEINSLNYK